MKKLLHYLFLFTTAVSFTSPVFSQYILNGAASQNSCNCYTLTQAVNTQSGSVWNANKISLNASFDFHFNVFLGCVDGNGADGIVFILQPISTSIGATGEGMGFQGIPTSIGITLDTWQNFNLSDPIDDHISIQANGYIIHDASANNLAGPVQVSATNPNIEDCQWHVLRITWDATTHWLRAYFDDILRVETQKDIVTDIFNNDPMVYWGFSAATGGANNLQQFCTALNPDFRTNFSNNDTCFGAPVIFTDESESFTAIQSFYWDFGDGNTSTLQNPPPHNYSQPGGYIVKHVIVGLDGCVSDTMTKTINLGSKPVSNFAVYDTCSNSPPRIIDQSTNLFGAISQWTWLLDGVFISNVQQPVLPALFVGGHQLKLVVSSQYGCVSDTITKNFLVKARPVISMTVNNGCINQPVQFAVQQLDNATFINQWNWNFGDGNTSTQQNPSHSFAAAGNYPVQIFAMETNGCSSDTLQQMSIVGVAPVAGFMIYDTCEGTAPVLTNNTTISSGAITQWNWVLNGQPFSTSQTPDFSSLPAGAYQLELTATGNTGCISNIEAHNFLIKNRPSVTANGIDGCFNQPIQFTASQTDNNTTIQQWDWNFNDGQNSQLQNPLHVFSSGGTYNIILRATASNGCISSPVQFPVKINQLRVNAGNDTIAILNVPFQLQGNVSATVNGQLSYNWLPAIGLNNPAILRPNSTLQNDQVYILTVTSAEGCVVKDTIAITVFKGSAIYVPTGFTPNNDGLNDRLKPWYIGITKLDYFIIYNRWGEMLFKTSDLTKGWDGVYKGKSQGSGTFVWIISAEDYTGKKHQLKGTTTIIK